VARAACVAITAATADTRHVSLGIRLLADLRTVFGDEHGLHTTYILDRLRELDEAPWATLRDEGLDARGLANLLGDYDITSTQVWIDGVNRRGYLRADLVDAWSRYLPDPQEGARSARSDSEQVTEQVPDQAPSPPSAPSPSMDAHPTPRQCHTGDCASDGCSQPLVTRTDHETGLCIFCRDIEELP
jgi:Protein of unknown function (DUF3631)